MYVETSEKTEKKTGAKKPKGHAKIIPQRCKGCGYCVAFCPLGVLELSPEFNAKGYHPPRVADADKCSGCDLCGMFCPDFAIYGVRNNKGKRGSKDGDESDSQD